MDRRKFLGFLATSGFGAFGVSNAWADDSNAVLFPIPTSTRLRGSVVVVGGGMAGTTVAKYLRLWGGTGVSVTLVEKDPHYTSNIMSNTVLTGQRELASLHYTHDVLTSHYGVQRVAAEVLGIDTANRQLQLSTGATLDYAHLILAPGLEFDLLPGMSRASEYDNLIPHAWQAGAQTQLLRDQLVAMRDGDNVVMTIPLAPYRCPPGPYERASVIADWLKTNKPNSQIIVLDANPQIIVERENFEHAFFITHAGVVDYRAGITLSQVNSMARTVAYRQNAQSFEVSAGVLNPIPPQRAPRLLADAGLLNSPNGRFAAVNVLSYESTAERFVHVIGDASHTTQPKAGHIGNQQAKTCADAILRQLGGQQPDPAPVTNSACYTPITSSTATWLSAVYQYDPGTGTMIIPTQHNNGKAIAAPVASTENYKDMQVWFKTLMGDSFS